MFSSNDTASTDGANFLDAQGVHASISFATAFTETLAVTRLSTRDELTDAGMPDGYAAEQATDLVISTMFDVLRDTRLEPLAERIAWGIVHSFQKVADQLEGEADRAAQRVRSLIDQIDGSEVAATELEEAQTHCQSLDEASGAIACMRDRATAIFHAETGRPWSSPRATLVSGKRTASVINATDFLAARRQRRIDAHAPTGPVVIFSGGPVWENHKLLWDRLDLVRARIPNMFLATTAQDKGCDAIAAAWAASRGVKLIAFTLDRRLGKRAGFARNEQLMKLQPVEAIVCEGSGLQSHLAREVRAHRVPAHFFRLADQGRS